MGKFYAVCAQSGCDNVLKTQQELDANWTCVDCQRKQRYAGCTDQELIDMLATLRDSYNLLSGETAFERHDKKVMAFDVQLLITELKIRGHTNT